MSVKSSRTRETVKHLIVWGVLVSTFFPLYLMVAISFKTNDQFAVNPWTFEPLRNWHWENWTVGWLNVHDYIANSIVTSTGSVLFCLVMAIPASYVIARYRFPGRAVVYYGLLASMFLPGTAATLVTTFKLLQHLDMINSLWALTIMGAVGGQVVSIFILCQFIEEIPRELFEAAQMDGAGHIQQMLQVVLPLAAPILGTIAIMQFLGSWNELMLPLIIMRDDHLLTVPVGLMRLDGEYVKQWGPLMAGYAISSIPLIILFIFAMKLFVRGLAAGAVKG